MKKLQSFKNFINSVKYPIEFNLEPYNDILKEINQYNNKLENYSESQLINLSQLLKKKPGNSDDLLVSAYALVKEICIRKLKIIPFNVQIIGAIALDKGKLIEMQTGEGKTLLAVFAAYLNALHFGNIHILTFNDYLARRDAVWMGPVYEFLGLTCSFVNEGMSKELKSKAYCSNITYSSAKEVGFDYLRSTIAYDDKGSLKQSFNYAIVDEADAILIDEARNPLVLAGNLIKTDLNYKQIANFIDKLHYKSDYKADEYSRNIYLTDSGIKKAEKFFGIVNLYEDENLELHSAINLALQAKTLLRRDIDYIVKDGQIKLVDEFTGRIVEDRKWKNGLQTAVEAKENLKINREGSILSSITIPHLIQKYSKLSGMTATAQQASEEFKFFYNLKTVIIPSNKQCIRKDLPDVVFQTKAKKNKAIIKEIIKVNNSGQPILVGTLTVKESEELSDNLKDHGIKCAVLNAKNDESEAEIISEAGRLNAVTISTNMAGRGTDIILGGPGYNDKDQIERLGGLYVIGTNRHESLRIDRQLRGRAGRQGDIGSSRFFISLEDDLMVRYNLEDILPEKVKSNYDPLNDISHIQRVIEGQMFDLRRFLFTYSSLIEKQRVIIQNERDKVLKDLTISAKVKTAILFQYDKFWARHLDFLSELKEGIHLLRIGGINPLREYQKKADLSFSELCNNLDNKIEEIKKYFKQNPQADLISLGIKKPTSTWTYIINDFPFGNQLGLLLLDNSNIGFQVDIISLTALFFYRLFRKTKRAITRTV